MRHTLELINAYRFGVSIVTKSSLVAHDVDILKDIKEHSPATVKFSITTADDRLARLIEPNASLPSERFAAMKILTKAGIICGVLIVPVLPFITDNEENIKEIVKKAYEAGASYVYTYFGMTLRPGSREYYYKNLDQHFPNLTEKYQKYYGLKKDISSFNYKKLWAVFIKECQQYGLIYEMSKIIRYYQQGYRLSLKEQLSSSTRADEIDLFNYDKND
jgi:DNA repair photolyase